MIYMVYISLTKKSINEKKMFSFHPTTVIFNPHFFFFFSVSTVSTPFFSPSASYPQTHINDFFFSALLYPYSTYLGRASHFCESLADSRLLKEKKFIFFSFYSSQLKYYLNIICIYIFFPNPTLYQCMCECAHPSRTSLRLKSTNLFNPPFILILQLLLLFFYIIKQVPFAFIHSFTHSLTQLLPPLSICNVKKSFNIYHC